MSRLKVKMVPFVVLAAVVALAGAAGCSKSGSVNSQPPATTRAPLPAGWTLHTTEYFEIAVPDTWITLEVTPEAVDAMIERMGDANPDLVPYLEAIRRQDAMKFWGGKLNPSGFNTSVVVGKTVGLLPLDYYESDARKEYAKLGRSVLGSRRLRVNGDDALILNVEGTVNLPNGEPVAMLGESLIIDHEGDYYSVTLSYAKVDAELYPILFDQIIRTFLIK